MQPFTMEDNYITLENLRISDSLEAALDTNSHQTNPDTYQKLLGINQSSVKTQLLIQLWNVARTTKQYSLIDAIHELNFAGLNYPVYPAQIRLRKKVVPS